MKFLSSSCLSLSLISGQRDWRKGFWREKVFSRKIWKNWLGQHEGQKQGVGSRQCVYSSKRKSAITGLSPLPCNMAHQHLPLCLTHVSIMFCSSTITPPKLCLKFGSTVTVDFSILGPYFRWGEGCLIIIYTYPEALCSTYSSKLLYSLWLLQWVLSLKLKKGLRQMYNLLTFLCIDQIFKLLKLPTNRKKMF